MKLLVKKYLHLTPAEVLAALAKAGLVDKDCCEQNVELVSKTDNNKGRTVIISWYNTEKEIIMDYDSK